MSSHPVQTIKAAHQVLAEYRFAPVRLERGYANRALRIDLSERSFRELPVTQEMKDLWVGGKGFDLWYMFQEITAATRWDSPENPICFASGPLGGTLSFPGSGKTLVTSISPQTHSVMDCNVGGYFGPYLKFAGFDALVLTGIADSEVIVYLDAVDRRITIEKAPLESVDSHLVAEELTEMYADGDLDKKNIAVVSAGRGAEHAYMGCLNFSFYDWRRQAVRLKQAGRGGIGTVFRHKKVKALVIRNRGVTPAWHVEENKVAHLITPRRVAETLPAADLAKIGRIADRWHRDPDYVIEMMQDVQEEFRHIPKPAIDHLNRLTGVPKAYLYHIATFYKAFSLEPKGETTIQVCLGTACHVKGGANLLASLERILDVKAGGTTKDNKYTLDAVACLGACSIAPVVKIGDEVHGNVKAKDLEKLLRQAGKGKPARRDHDRAAAAAEAPAATGACACDLGAIRERERAKTAAYKGMLMVCTGTGCVAAKGFDVRDRLRELLRENQLDRDYLVVPTGCNGFCAVGPIVVVQPEGTFYQMVQEADLQEIIDTHLKGGRPVERLLHRDPLSGKINPTMRDIAFFSKQQLIALRNKGLIDPENIDHYIARGGYEALARTLAAKSGDDVIREVIRSGLRGRGGGGFPAGLKWESGRKAARERQAEIFVVCNADEGDPGAFMDRSIIETDPHTVIEGMLIGAFAVGARQGFIYIRKEYPLALERLQKALAQARERGLLGEKILGRDFAFDIRVHRGAGAFVCGESSALMASMSGRAGEPRAKYVHNVEYGYRDQPTVLNNVETWANIPVIMDRGAEWFAAIGTGDVSRDPWRGSSGTKVFSLVGNIRNTGLVEVPMGITLREIIEDVGGGIPDGRKFKAVQTGGPSGGCLPASLLDMPVDFDSLTAAGSMMGSGGMIVMNDRTCMVDVARYFIDFLMDESCGKCTPCREGLKALSDTLNRICRGEGKESDLDLLAEVSATVAETSLCQLGGSAPNPVLSTLKYFREEYLEHIRDRRCRAGVCKPLIAYTILDTCTGCLACVKPCPTGAISGVKKQVHVIDQDLCIKCGICHEVCKFDAVEVK
ncbi:MAG TPA: NAD(P)H-dependent oxidoreductase subunit E [Candidatus Krumholzibacteria bacterium]|nr:NAD(P)H-dependent oxidoreductase subunit E [Candidatus Krumholzibacteria bacterium]HPD70263.1 NAD(P)H-dependent oxidoreductase subunit E [Candidatus Krumholzibacteria bacterium]HRY40037.1 NAD(P)H-dependent oxidoreductase subunit E [Candidatus Krumholzibacteria bacterium]